jgi:putative ABC transport system substrate-binding protein
MLLRICTLEWGELQLSKKILVFALGAYALCSQLPAEAQQPTKIPLIGRLGASDSPERTEAFRQGLRELGYVEGKNIVIEWRDAEGKSDRLPALAAELVRLNVDVIVTGGGQATSRRQGSDDHDSHCHDAG